MPYREFTDDEIKGFKAKSAESHDGRVERIDYDDPIETTVVVAPFTRAEFAVHVDNRNRDVMTGNVGAFLTQALWPDLAALEALRQEWPALPGKVAADLRKIAGVRDEAPILRKLDLAMLPTGLARDTASALIKDHGARLWSMEIPEYNLSLAMKPPIADTWLAATAADADARAVSKGIVRASEPYVLATVVWQNIPLEGPGGAIERHPALFWDLYAAFRMMGGDGARGRRKSL